MVTTLQWSPPPCNSHSQGNIYHQVGQSEQQETLDTLSALTITLSWLHLRSFHGFSKEIYPGCGLHFTNTDMSQAQASQLLSNFLELLLHQSMHLYLAKR